jgi:hypothetical protein
VHGLSRNSSVRSFRMSCSNRAHQRHVDPQRSSRNMNICISFTRFDLGCRDASVDDVVSIEECSSRQQVK